MKEDFAKNDCSSKDSEVQRFEPSRQGLVWYKVQVDAYRF